MRSEVVGWDIGGAHIKAVWLGDTGVIKKAMQQPCALWQGLHELNHAMDAVLVLLNLPHDVRHALTMTGELVDAFPNRLVGVQQIAQLVSTKLGQDLQFYAGEAGFIHHAQVKEYARSIASMNWHASARWLAKHYVQGLLIDIGSTTTDFIPFVDGRIDTPWYTDAERLSHHTLLYTGVVRTPLMALAQGVSFKGLRYHLVAEYFATTADVYRLLGRLSEGADQAPTADGLDKTLAASWRRLARMLGHDREDCADDDWQALAQVFAEVQLDMLQQSVVMHPQYQHGIVGIGAGAFLAETLAHRLGVPYTHAEQGLPSHDVTMKEAASICFPAYAVAQLLHDGI